MHIIKTTKPLQVATPSPLGRRDAADPSYGEFVAGAGSYHERIERCAQHIRQTDNVNEIIHILHEALLETRALHSSNEVQAAREQVERAERKIESLKNELEQLRVLVHADPLTGALNRGGLDEAFAREAARADRRSSPLCLALLDLDDFKRLNDTCGHQTGDHALLHLVNVAKETLRPNDIIARFGGEEFVILLPDTGVKSAMSVVYRLQCALAKNCVLHSGKPLSITFSAGVALRARCEPLSTAIERADHALYEAKRAGKNQVFTAP